MHWDASEVKVISPTSLQVTFVDGTQGEVVFKSSHFTGVFESLKDPQLFQQAHIEDGAITWPNQLDLAPDAMYEAIKAQGQWVLS